MSGVAIEDCVQDNGQDSSDFLVQFALSAVSQTHGLLLERTESSPVKRAYSSLRNIADGLTDNPLAEFLKAKEAIIFAEEHYMLGNDNRYENMAFLLLKQRISDCEFLI